MFTKFQKVEVVTPLKPNEAEEVRKIAAQRALDKPKQ